MSHVDFLAVLNNRPVFLELVRVVVAFLLSVLLDERAGAVELAIDCLDSYLCAVFLACISIFLCDWYMWDVLTLRIFCPKTFAFTIMR